VSEVGKRIALDKEIPADGIPYNAIDASCLDRCSMMQQIPGDWRLAALRRCVLQTQVWCPGAERGCKLASEPAKQALAAAVRLVPEAIEIAQQGEM